MTYAPWWRKIGFIYPSIQEYKFLWWTAIFIFFVICVGTYIRIMFLFSNTFEYATRIKLNFGLGNKVTLITPCLMGWRVKSDSGSHVCIGSSKISRTCNRELFEVFGKFIVCWKLCIFGLSSMLEIIYFQLWMFEFMCSMPWRISSFLRWIFHLKKIGLFSNINLVISVSTKNNVIWLVCYFGFWLLTSIVF